MRVHIHITFKPGILDPQGRAIQQSLATLGFSSVSDVRVGKFLELDLAETDVAKAQSQIKAMCEKLLANTVIENYRYELIP